MYGYVELEKEKMNRLFSKQNSFSNIMENFNPASLITNMLSENEVTLLYLTHTPSVIMRLLLENRITLENVKALTTIFNIKFKDTIDETASNITKILSSLSKESQNVLRTFLLKKTENFKFNEFAYFLLLSEDLIDDQITEEKLNFYWTGVENRYCDHYKHLLSTITDQKELKSRQDEYNKRLHCRGLVIHKIDVKTRIK